MERARVDRLDGEAWVCSGREPAARPVRTFWDGLHLWLAVSRREADAEGLGDGARLTVGRLAAEGATLAEGDVRRYEVRDPLRLALHAPSVGGALIALAATGDGARRDVLGAALGLAASGQVVLRLRPDRVDALPVPEPPAGPPPALPADVPMPVRQGLGPLRAGLVAVDGRFGVAGVGVDPDGALRLDGGPADGDGDALVCLGGRELGLSLHGRLDAGRLHVRLARWWIDGAPGQTRLTGPAHGGIALPD